MKKIIAIIIFLTLFKNNYIYSMLSNKDTTINIEEYKNLLVEIIDTLAFRKNKINDSINYYIFISVVPYKYDIAAGDGIVFINKLNNNKFTDKINLNILMNKNEYNMKNPYYRLLNDSFNKYKIVLFNLDTIPYGKNKLDEYTRYNDNPLKTVKHIFIEKKQNLFIFLTTEFDINKFYSNYIRKNDYLSIKEKYNKKQGNDNKDTRVINYINESINFSLPILSVNNNYIAILCVNNYLSDLPGTGNLNNFYFIFKKQNEKWVYETDFRYNTELN